MPTYQERLEEFRRQRTSSPSNAAPPSPNSTFQTSPNGLELQGMTLGGRTPIMRYAVPKQKTPPQPKPLTAKQQDAIDGLLGTSATLKELVGMLDQHPEIDTGLTNLSLRRDTIGDVARTFSKPEVTQLAQVSNRMQDAYRRYVTGVQAGFQEVASFLPSSIPNPATLPRDKYLAAIDTFSREVERSKEPLRRAMKLRGYSEEQIEEMFAPLEQLSNLPSAVGGTATLSPSAQALVDRYRGQ